MDFAFSALFFISSFFLSIYWLFFSSFIRARLASSSCIACLSLSSFSFYCCFWAIDVSFRVLLRDSSLPAGLLSMSMLLRRRVHSLYRALSCEHVKAREEVLSIADNLRTLSKSSKVVGRLILSAAWAQKSLLGARVATNVLTVSLSLAHSTSSFLFFFGEESTAVRKDCIFLIVLYLE